MFVSSEIIKVYFLLTCVAVISSSSGRNSERTLPGRTSFQPAVGKGTTALTQAYFLLTIPALNTLNTFPGYFHSVFVAIDNMSANRLEEFKFFNKDSEKLI